MVWLIVSLLMGICLCLPGCGEEEASGPEVVSDTTPPAIIGTNVQGGPIPVNTPIILVFSERVDLTSARLGISVRSTIDAEPVKGVVTLDKNGMEVKFTPTERMTSGGYVLTAIGIEDVAGNISLMPISIFFGAVEVDTTQPPADVIPPSVVSTIPAGGQSAKETESLTVRFSEEVDADSAQAGILVSGVAGTVEVTGAVAIFRPMEPMKPGVYNLLVTGVRDKAGNVLESSVIVSFEVISSDISKPPGGVLFRAFSKDRPVPDAAVEDEAAWNANAVTAVTDFAVEGDLLVQSADGCANSTKVPFPGVDGSNWADYTVAVDMSWRSDIADANDALSILFRYTDENSYYNFTIGASDFGETWYLCTAVAIEIDCFPNPPDAALTLASGPNGLTIVQDASGVYTAAVTVTGGKIEVFFGEQVDVLGGEMPPKVGEVTDSAYKRGTAGLHMGSCPASYSNMVVLGPGGFAVDARGKLPAVWGVLKSNH
jgi:hypothetical protein